MQSLTTSLSSLHCANSFLSPLDQDTVQTFNPHANAGKGEGTGWALSPLSVESMLGALRVASGTFIDYKPSWEGLMKRGMAQDYTWENAAVQYEQVFDWVFFDAPYVK